MCIVNGCLFYYSWLLGDATFLHDNPSVVLNPIKVQFCGCDKQHSGYLAALPAKCSAFLSIQCTGVSSQLHVCLTNCKLSGNLS